MKWRIPAALLTVCSLALLFFFGMLQETTNDLAWMIAFSGILLFGFGVLYAGAALILGFGRSNPSDPTHNKRVSSEPVSTWQTDNRLQQSEFSRQWKQTRHGVTYDENIQERREAGTQIPQRLKLTGDNPNPSRPGLWPKGFRNIDDKK
jgi:hypothetical protein